MYISTSSASRARFATSSLSRFSSSFCKPLSLSAPAVTASASQSSVSFVYQRYRSLSFSSTLGSLRCSTPRWSYGADWSSLVSLHRKIATIASEHAYKDILISLPKPGGGEFGKFYSLPALNDPRIDRLLYSIRILLESAIWNCDNFQVTKDNVEKIIGWENTSPNLVEIAFKPARFLLQFHDGIKFLDDFSFNGGF